MSLEERGAVLSLKREREQQSFACKWGSQLENTVRLIESTSLQNSSQQILNQHSHRDCVHQRPWLTLEIIIQTWKTQLVTGECYVYKSKVLLLMEDWQRCMKMAPLRRFSCVTAHELKHYVTDLAGKSITIINHSAARQLWFTQTFMAGVQRRQQHHTYTTERHNAV